MNKLREVRLEKGLNQRQLSEASHTPQAIVSALEREVQKPWPKVAKRLSRVLKMPVYELFPEDLDRIVRGKK